MRRHGECRLNPLREARSNSAESIDLFIGDQALSYDLAPPPPLFPWESCLSVSVFLCVDGRAYWQERRGGGGGGGAKSYDGEKAWSSINHSILFISVRYLQQISYFFRALITTSSQGLLLLIYQCITVGMIMITTVQYTVWSPAGRKGPAM